MKLITRLLVFFLAVGIGVSESWADRELFTSFRAIDYVYVDLYNPSSVSQNAEVTITAADGLTFLTCPGACTGGNGMDCPSARTCRNKVSERVIPPGESRVFGIRISNHFAGGVSKNGAAVKVSVAGDDGFLVGTVTSQCLFACSGNNLTTVQINGGRPF